MQGHRELSGCCSECSDAEKGVRRNWAGISTNGYKGNQVMLPD